MREILPVLQVSYNDFGTKTQLFSSCSLSASPQTTHIGDRRVSVLQSVCGDGRILCFYSLNKDKWGLRAGVWLCGLFLCLLAVRERQSDGVLLSQGSQLLQELAEDDGTVHGVLHSQRLGLLLQPGGPSAAAAAAAPEQSAVQRLAAVPYVCEGQLSGVPSPGRAVGVTKDQVSERCLTTLHWNRQTIDFSRASRSRFSHITIQQTLLVGWKNSTSSQHIFSVTWMLTSWNKK